MQRRHPFPERDQPPRRWLMTDERMGDDLWRAVARLPRGSGIVFRHYSLPPVERRALFDRIARIAGRRRLALVWGGPHASLPSHGRHPGALTAPVHSRREALAAKRSGAALIFVSPVYATQSHPGAAALGPVRFGLMKRGIDLPVVALGGMTERRWRALRTMHVHGWAAIDAWLCGRND